MSRVRKRSGTIGTKPMGWWALPLLLVGSAWITQKAQIEENYRRILEEFEVRCRASLT